MKWQKKNNNPFIYRRHSLKYEYPNTVKIQNEIKLYINIKQTNSLPFV